MSAKHLTVTGCFVLSTTQDNTSKMTWYNYSMNYGSIENMKERIVTLEDKISAKTDALNLRIRTLENLIEHQSEAYLKGYMQAMKDNRLLLTDIDLENLDSKYRAALYAKALDVFNKAT